MSMSTKEITESLILSFNPEEWIAVPEVAVRGCNGRIDVCAVRRRQYLRKQIRGYEVKISRSDFLSDVGSQKWRKYLSVCHQVYFATPAGLLRKEEIPSGAGLIVLGDKGWQVIKSAPVHDPENLDADAVLSILFSSTRQMESSRDKLARQAALNRLSMSDVTKRLGGELSRRIAGLSPKAERESEKIVREVNKLFGSNRDAISALRAAAIIKPESDLLGRIGDFISGLAQGFYREEPSCIDKEIKLLSDKEHEKEVPLVISNSQEMDKEKVRRVTGL